MQLHRLAVVPRHLLITLRLLRAQPVQTVQTVLPVPRPPAPNRT